MMIKHYLQKRLLLLTTLTMVSFFNLASATAFAAAPSANSKAHLNSIQKQTAKKMTAHQKAVLALAVKGSPQQSPKRSSRNKTQNHGKPN